MSTATAPSPSSPAPTPVKGRPAAPRHRGRIIVAAVVAVVVIAAALSTKVVSNDSELLVGPAAFDADVYGEEQFPLVQQYVTDNAVEATTLAQALATDPGAGVQYGVASSSGIGAVVPVTLEGVVQAPDQSGLPVVAVDGVPEGYVIHVQLGPVVNGTDLRDVTGEVSLNDFENQIQLQDAGAALNDQLRSQVLAPYEGQDLTGSTIDVTGVVTLINPQNWTVTPVSLEVVS